MREKKQDRRFFLFLLLWPLLAILLLGLWMTLRGFAQKPLLRRQVTKNLPAMTALAEETLAGADGPVWTREMVVPDSGDSVWYETRSVGLVPASKTYGYCYLAGGAPRPYPGMEDYEEVPVMFGFRWQEPGGDNGCYLEHIDGDFYYYEVWF